MALISKAMLEHDTLKVATHCEETEWNSILEALLGKVGLVAKFEQSKGRYDKSGAYRISGKSKPIFAILRDVGLVGSSKTKRIPPVLLDTNENVLKGLLDGIFSTDGNFNNTSNNPILRFSTVSRDLTNDVRNILLMFGMHCSVYTSSRNRDSRIGERVIKGKPIHVLSISGASIKTFYEQIGITHPDKKKRLFNGVKDWSLTGNTWKARITFIAPAGNATVYDLFEPLTDTWITNGYVSRGCGEQPLAPFGSCNLGAINLTKFVTSPFTDKADFAFLDFYDCVRTAVRFLDDILDVNYYPLQGQKEDAMRKRKIGLGIMGLGSALAMLGARYGSDDSIQWVDKIMAFMRDTAYAYSVEIAEEKGDFPFFDPDKYLASAFIRDLPESIRDAIKAKGIRNGNLLTIAPTGSISQLAGNVSSGVEPIFCIEYERTNYGEDVSIKDPTFQLYCELFGTVSAKRAPGFLSAPMTLRPKSICV